MIGDSSNDIDGSIHIPRGTKIKGDVFTGGKRVVQTGGGDYFEHIEHYHERRHLPAPRQAPALPSYFQPRPELAEQALTPLSAASQSVVAITGPNGVGKTTLASLVARETAARFSDGILWGELKGQVGEREEMLGSFLDALDIDKDEIRPFDARVKTLRSALNNRCFLLVLDNLSDETLDPSSLLPVNGDVCVLITTSNRDLAAAVTDHVVDIPPFSTEMAHDLLLKLVSDELLQLPSDLLSNILHQTGGFPLFLVNVGRQGRRLKRRGQKALSNGLQTQTSIGVIWLRCTNSPIISYPTQNVGLLRS